MEFLRLLFFLAWGKPIPVGKTRAKATFSQRRKR